jgi:uncharacterized flavoprotein (TIGR03862 family)
MKASPILRAWIGRLQNAGVTFHPRHKWIGWNEDRSLRFLTGQGEAQVRADAAVLALGGGSWRRLGSDGAWVGTLKQAGVEVEALRPSNCGFDVNWSEHLRTRFHGEPLKSVILSFGDSFCQQGEFIVTKTGVEGSLIYAASAQIRDEIQANGKAVIQLDLAPGSSLEQVIDKLSRPRGSKSLANFLEKTMKFRGVKAALLREVLPKDALSDPERLAHAIKALPLVIVAPRPLDEAISSAGGIVFDELDENLMLRKSPGVFCAGEMLDWEAPTGGYLLTACFSTGRAAGAGALKWLHDFGPGAGTSRSISTIKDAT